jgi:hypothetical protein
MQTKDWLVPALTIAGSFLGAWLAAHFALASFYRERIWERKAAAYSAIFEALAVINRWYDKNYDALITYRELPTETKMKLRTDANAAEDELERCLARETWILPATSRHLLNKLTTDLKETNNQEPFIYLDASLGMIDKAVNELRQIVQADLGTK